MNGFHTPHHSLIIRSIVGQNKFIQFGIIKENLESSPKSMGSLMRRTIFLPIISSSPSLLVRITGKDSDAIEIRDKIIKYLKTPVKLFASLTNITNFNNNGTYTEYLFITFNSEEDLNRSKEKISELLRTEGERRRIEYRVIPYLKWGFYYLAEEWPNIYYEPTSMETVIIPIDRILNIFRALHDMLGPGTRPLFLELGKDDGKWVARRYKNSLIELINKLEIAKLVEVFMKTLMHFGFFFEEEISSEGYEITIKVWPRIAEGPDAMAIRELMIPIIRYHYGFLYGIFDEVGVEPHIEVNAATGRIERLRVRIKEKIKEHTFTIKIMPRDA